MQQHIPPITIMGALEEALKRVDQANTAITHLEECGAWQLAGKKLVAAGEELVTVLMGKRPVRELDKGVLPTTVEEATYLGAALVPALHALARMLEQVEVETA
jgi:hypothetical protein